MLIKSLLDLIYNILDWLLFMQLPSLPASFVILIDEVVSYIMTGLSVIRAFIGNSAFDVLLLVFSLVLSANLLYFTWSIVFWILRKIPMLGIKE